MCHCPYLALNRFIDVSEWLVALAPKLFCATGIIAFAQNSFEAKEKWLVLAILRCFSGCNTCVNSGGDSGYFNC